MYLPNIQCAFKDTWHLWEYFDNQSARCNLNSISSFLSHGNQNGEHWKLRREVIWKGLTMIMMMRRCEPQSLFLGFIRFPQLVLCGSYDGITTRPNRGQTGQPRGGDSRVLGFYLIRFMSLPLWLSIWIGWALFNKVLILKAAISRYFFNSLLNYRHFHTWSRLMHLFLLVFHPDNLFHLSCHHIWLNHHPCCIENW